MLDVAFSVGYMILFASIFGCIFLGLFRWNNEEKDPLEDQKEGA